MKILKNKKNIALLVLFLFSMAILYLAHHVYGFYDDDYWFMTNLATDYHPLQSLSDIFEGQRWFFFNFSGRIPAHSLLQLSFLLCNSTAIDIVNVIATGLLIFLLCKTAGIRGFEAPLFAFALLFGASGSSPLWETCLLWQSGVANYLYMPIFTTLFFWIYIRQLRGQKSLPLTAVWIVPLGLIAGWSNENVGPVLWILSLLIIVLGYRKSRKIPVWMILGNIFCFIGSILVLRAPGNFVRAGYSVETNRSLLWIVFNRVFNELHALYRVLFPLILLCALLFVLGHYGYQIKLGCERLLYLLAAVLSWGAMIFSPVYSSRAFFAPYLFLVLFCLSYLKDLLAARKKLYVPLLGVMAIFWTHGIYALVELCASQLNVL